MTLKVIRGRGQGHVRLKVLKMTIFKFYLRHFSTNHKNRNPTVSDTRPKYLKSLGSDFLYSMLLINTVYVRMCVER